MQTYDLVMLLVLAGCTIFGFYKGMAWQLASLASLVLSYFVALNFCDQLAPHIGAEPPLNRIGAMLALYLGTSLVVWLVFRAVKGAIDKIKLKDFDHQVGGMFGTLKGVLFCLVITFFAVTLSERARDAIVRSRSGYYMSRLIERAKPLLPEGVDETLGPYLDRLDEELQTASPELWDQPGEPTSDGWADGASGGSDYRDGWNPEGQPAEPRSARLPWDDARDDLESAVDTADRLRRAAEAYRQPR
jgi:membrane protein required for colicin V production